MGDHAIERQPIDSSSLRTSSIRHEAFNLLMVIELACENLLEEIPESSSLQEDVQQIVEAKKRLVTLIEATRRDDSAP